MRTHTELHQFLVSRFQDFVWTDRQTDPTKNNTCSLLSWRAGKHESEFSGINIGLPFIDCHLPTLHEIQSCCRGLSDLDLNQTHFKAKHCCLWPNFRMLKQLYVWFYRKPARMSGDDEGKWAKCKEKQKLYACFIWLI